MKRNIICLLKTNKKAVIIKQVKLHSSKDNKKKHNSRKKYLYRE